MAEVVFEKFKKQIRTLNALNGVDVFEEREIWKVPAAQFFFFIVASFWVCFIAQIVGVRDLLNLSMSMNTLGTTLQGLTTVACVVFNKAAYNALFERIKTFHCTISEHKAEEAVKARYRSLIQLVIKLYVLAFVVGAFGIDFLPIPLTILTGVKTLPFGQNIPFIDHTTSPGYEITYIYQIFLTFLCVPNMCGFQSLYVIAMGHFCCVGDLLVEKIMRKEEHGENKRFREILTLHYEFMDLHNLVEGLYGYYNTVLIMTTGLSVALGIVVLMRYSWIQGYIFIIMGFTNLLVTCIYGHLVETKTEKLEKALFNDLNWISMSTSDQRSAVLMLHMVQNKQQFCSGKLFILGFDLYVLVVKRIYSLCMMLRQF